MAYKQYVLALLACYVDVINGSILFHCIVRVFLLSACTTLRFIIKGINYKSHWYNVFLDCTLTGK